MYTEPSCPTRSPFQRDRDRIIHASAFRRLTYKTQVFLFHEGDHFRSRLTHSLEVAQIARTIARQLRLDEDLAEALALAHDLGHSPFGHAGERALDNAMREFGGFDHNAQSVRVVTMLERKYPEFDGLNLTWELLEGLVKHNGPVTDHAHPVAKVARRTEAWRALDLDRWASAEAQVASLADDIAYLSHDVDDGLRAGLLTLDVLVDAPVAGAIAAENLKSARTTPIEPSRAFYGVTRRMITIMIADIVEETRRRLTTLGPKSPDDIRNANGATVAFTRELEGDLATLKRFLFANVYHHPRVLQVMQSAEQVVGDLFQRYRFLGTAAALPVEWQAMMHPLPDHDRARLVADYIAGQTDRFALAEHRRLFDATPELR